MKLKTKKVGFKLPKTKPAVEPVPGIGLVKITHHQEVKQSLDYQSASAGYGVEMYVNNDEDAIEEGIVKCEILVEGALLGKFKDQRRLLEKLSGS